MSEPVLLTPTSTTTILNGEVLVSWDPAVDSQSHEITYSLQYSSDNGTTWQTLFSNLNATSYLWDTSLLNDGEKILIRIGASDGVGINTYDISENSFTISNPEPSSSVPPSSSSKPSESSTGATTTSGLELLSVVFSLMGILLIRKKKNYN